MHLTLRQFAFVGCVLSLLAACGGGKEESPVSDIPYPVNSSEARSLIAKSTPLALTSDKIWEHRRKVIKSASSLLLSDYLMLSGKGSPKRIQVYCRSPKICSIGNSHRIRISDISTFTAPEGSVSEAQPVMIKNGVSLAQGRGRAEIEGEDFRVVSYGGWLEHSYFAGEAGRFEEGRRTPIVFYSIGRASDANSAPKTGRGVWKGVMIGADVSATPKRGNVIQGDAEIVIADFSDPKVRVEFTEIYDLNAGSHHKDMKWNEIPVKNGSFEKESDTNSIKGKFYGPRHEEVGGIFERAQVIGAFGAKRHQ